jgi:hypothetical protein
MKCAAALLSDRHRFHSFWLSLSIIRVDLSMKCSLAEAGWVPPDEIAGRCLALYSPTI